MNAVRWQRARELFETAVVLSDDETRELLDRECAGDHELRSTLEGLLEHAVAGRDGWLDDGVSGAMVREALAPESLEGARVGDFLVRGVLGSGGMSTVYEAEQQHPRRIVALKVMRSGLRSESARRRFEYESQVLADLRHPGIAQVFATGTHGGKGQELPFIAMELVEAGRPFSAWVEEQRLGLTDLLRLFGEVCDAVHHGHQRGVIHLDLKPHNVLVDGAGRPRVIDFGIARAVAGGPDREAHRGEVLGTPGYTSPEQLGSGPGYVDVRSDVYALGAMLYEVVAGRLPFLEAGVPIAEAIRTAATAGAEPDRPSGSATRHRGDPRLAELDWVVLKCLATDPEDRYPSVAELAADLERILGHHAILARPPSRLYQARKFARRHRAGVLAAAVVLLSLLAGITAVTLSLIETRRAERQARLEAETRKIVADFLGGLFKSVNPYIDGKDVKVIDLLDRASAAADTLYAGRPIHEAELRTTLGDSYLGLGQVARAREHFAAALQLDRDHRGADHPRTLEVIQGLASCHLRQREFDQAERLVTGSLADIERVFGPRHRNTAKALALLGHIAYRRQDYELAVRRFEAAREILTESSGPGERDTVAVSSALGVALAEIGRDRDAGEVLRDAITHGAAELGEDHPSVLTARNNLATHLLEHGEFREAATTFEKVFRAEEQVLGEHHPATLKTLNNVASAFTRLGSFAEAEARYVDLVARRKASGQYQHLHTAVTLGNLSQCLESQGRLDQAEKRAREALSMLEACGIPRKHWITAANRKNLAVVLTGQKRYDEAEAALRECIGIFATAPGDQSARLRKAREALVSLYEAWGKAAQAEEVRQQLAGAGR